MASIYWVSVSFYDAPRDVEEYETAEEAAGAYSSALEQRESAGLYGFGDCARIAWGCRTGGRSVTRQAVDFD